MKLKEVNKVKKEDLRTAARMIIDDKRMSLAFISPLKDIEGQMYKLLKVS